MSESFRKVVNAPHKFAGRVRKKIQETQPESTTGKTARAAGVAASGMAQFLLWLVKYVTVDNHLLRAGERAVAKMSVGKTKDGKDKKLAAFMKRNPNLTSHLAYYMLLGGMALGTAMYVGDNDMENKGEKTEQVETSASENVLVAEPNTYGAYLSRLQPMTPYLYALLVGGEGEKRDENGLHKPYLDSRNIPTIGTGSTVLKDGTKVTMDTPHMTDEEVYDLSAWHIEERETYWIMWIYDVMYNTLNVDNERLAFGLADVFYNSGSNLMEDPSDKNHQKRMAALRKDYAEYGYSMPDSLVRKRFEEYPVQALTNFGQALLGGKQSVEYGDQLGWYVRDGRGLQWRRWLEAGIMSGDIDPNFIFDCPVHGLPEFYFYMGKKYNNDPREEFIIDIKDKKGQTIGRKVNRRTYADFKEWIKNPVNQYGKSLSGWKKIRDVLPTQVMARCQDGGCKLNMETDLLLEIRPAVTPRVEKKTYVLGYEEEYKNARDALRANDIGQAVTLFEQLVEKNPDNALLRNDLAWTYDLAGRYDDAIVQAREVIFRIRDKKQYAAANYNAGYAYEKQGNLERALINYRAAVANGSKRVQADVDRVAKQLNPTYVPQVKKSKPAAGQNRKKGNVKKKTLHGKKTAFVKGKNNLSQNAFMRGLVKFNNGNDMA